MGRRTRDQTPVEEPEQRSRAAGGCVLVVLAGVALAAVWAASPEAGVLVVWTAGVGAVWWSARRRKGTNQPLPSPTVAPSRGEVYAVETGRAAEVVRGPGGLTIIRPEIEYVTEDQLP